MTEDRVNGVNGVFYWFFCIPWLQITGFCGVSYNWAWSGPGAAVLSDVNKPKQKKKGGEKVAQQQAVIMARR